MTRPQQTRGRRSARLAVVAAGVVTATVLTWTGTATAPVEPVLPAAAGAPTASQAPAPAATAQSLAAPRALGRTRPLAAAAPAAVRATTGLPSTCSARSTRHQRALERHLGLRVDGRNSPTDCGAIKAFQKRNGVRGASGTATALTAGIARRLDLALSRTDECQKGALVVCADLDSQTVWIAERGTVVFGPFPMRSGRPKFESDAGSFSVFLKSRHHFSSQYEVPMPYAMFYNNGEALHVSRRYLYRGKGTHGCVQILPEVAPEMWRRIGVGTRVHVFGSGSGGSTGTRQF